AGRLEPGLAEAERLPSRPDIVHGLRERAGGRRGAEARDGGADHVRRGAAEDPLPRRVDEDDPSVLVGHDDRIQRELDDGREPRLALPYRLLRLAELRDV